MKTALVYLLLVATMLPSISPWGTIAYYHVNKDYIARVLCENRNRPELHCDGKCYLAKKLKAQQDKQDKATTERVQNTPVLQLFCNDHSLFVFVPTGFDWLPTHPFAYITGCSALTLDGLFRPPRC